ncbi:MAG: hypothetical protein ACRC1H_13335 [Caldilineaceae bacterium]
MNLRDPKTPMGTVALLVVFLIMLVALWANAYFVMLSRGVTQ